MPAMNLDNTLWLASFVAEVAVVGLLLYRHVWRSLPVFCVYCAWSLFNTVGMYAILRLFPAGYLTAYLTDIVADSGLVFGVLIELAWSVFRPFRAYLSRGALVVVGGSVVALGAVIWPFASIPGFSYLPPEWHLLMRLQQTTDILRILFFLALAGCSQLLSIGWRDREMQVATGLGFYSLVGIAVAMLHTHLTVWSQYAHLNQVEVASYVCSLMYWVYSFAQKEAERQEFTPQMQNLLLAVAGAARSTRVGLTDSIAARSSKSREG
jgi:hypothetical protein